jgi:hypothetical protein
MIKEGMIVSASQARWALTGEMDLELSQDFSVQ